MCTSFISACAMVSGLCVTAKASLPIPKLKCSGSPEAAAQGTGIPVSTFASAAPCMSRSRALP